MNTFFIIIIFLIGAAAGVAVENYRLLNKEGYQKPPVSKPLPHIEIKTQNINELIANYEEPFIYPEDPKKIEHWVKKVLKKILLKDIDEYITYHIYNDPATFRVIGKARLKVVSTRVGEEND